LGLRTRFRVTGVPSLVVLIEPEGRGTRVLEAKLKLESSTDHEGMHEDFRSIDPTRAIAAEESTEETVAVVMDKMGSPAEITLRLTVVDAERDESDIVNVIIETLLT